MDGNRSASSTSRLTRDNCGRFSATRRWSVTSTSSAPYPPSPVRVSWRRYLAAPVTLPVTFRLTATFSLASSFHLPTGNVRQQRFVDIWRHSDQMNEVRSIRVKDLTTCTSCYPRLELHALSRSGLHGRQHARDHRRRIVRNRSPEPELPRRTCWRRKRPRGLRGRISGKQSRADSSASKSGRRHCVIRRHCVSWLPSRTLQPKTCLRPFPHSMPSGLYC